MGEDRGQLAEGFRWNRLSRPSDIQKNAEEHADRDSCGEVCNNGQNGDCKPCYHLGAFSDV